MKLFFLIFSFIPLIVIGQSNVQEIINQEYQNEHFSGAVLFAEG